MYASRSRANGLDAIFNGLYVGAQLRQSFDRNLTINCIVVGDQNPEIWKSP
jgi:hypothetical protein